MTKAKRVNKSKSEIVREVVQNDLQERVAGFNRAVEEAGEKFKIGITLTLDYGPVSVTPKIRLYDKKEAELAKV